MLKTQKQKQFRQTTISSDQVQLIILHLAVSSQRVSSLQLAKGGNSPKMTILKQGQESSCFVSTILVVLLTFGVFSEIQGGFYGAQCPPELGKKNGITLSCPADCIGAHNAAWGYCGTGEDYNCYCTKSMRLLQVLPIIRQSCPVQCYDRSEPKYEDLCRFDCLCNHAATDSKCNYFTKACECSGLQSNPTKNDLCPFKSIREMALYANGMNLPNVEFGVPNENGTGIKTPSSVVRCLDAISVNVAGI